MIKQKDLNLNIPKEDRFKLTKKTKQEKKDQSRENFIDFISQMTPDEINKFIIEKGKEPKLIDPLYQYKDLN